MDALGIPAGQRQIPGLARPGAEHHRVVLRQQVGGGQISAHLHAGAERNALRLHQADAALHHRLIQFHVGDAVHQQPARTVGLFQHSDLVAPVVQPVGAGQTGRAAANHRHPAAAAHSGRPGLHEPGGKAVLNQRQFVFPHGDRIPVEPAGAGRLAQSRADPAGEFGEIVGLEQTGQRMIPVAGVDTVVPFRDQVVQRAAGGHPVEHHAGLAERHAAVHAAGPLLPPLLLREGRVKFVEMPDTLQRVL